MAKGLTGQIYIENDDVVIVKEGFVMSLNPQGAKGTQRIPISSITAIGFKEPTLLSGNGYMQIMYPGAKIAPNPSDKILDGNCVFFSKKSADDFWDLKNAIEDKMSKARTPSSIEERDITVQIEKLYDLHQKGILTQEEYSCKKNELLAKL